MATLALFHAHPDDEAIITSGIAMRAIDQGHDVVLIFATRGELGLTERLGTGESLAEVRTAEAMKSASILGVGAVEFLGYRDSGMAGDPLNSDPSCFAMADVETAARRLADILVRNEVTVLTVYDAHGGYGHPDHIQVHRVGVAAAELAGVTRVYEASPNRDQILQMLSSDQGGPSREDLDFDVSAFGLPEAELTTRVDVSKYAVRKRQAIAAHASQVSEDMFFLTMPDDQFSAAFGVEWFRRRDVAPRRLDEDFEPWVM